MKPILLLLPVILATGPEGAEPREMDLSGWVALALENSPSIEASRASVLSAQAALRGDRAFYYPSLSATAGISRTWNDVPLPGGGSESSTSDSYSTGLTLSQELLQTGGSNWLYEDASELSVLAARADHRGVILDVTLEVVNAYLDVLEAAQLELAAANALERSESQLLRTGALYEMGAVSTLELLQVQVQESTDRLSLGRRRQAVESAYSGLYIAAGITAAGDPPEVYPESIPEPLDAEAVGRIPLDLSGNPSLEAADLRLQASGKRTEAAERTYWPSLRASAGWNWSDDTLDDIDRMFESDAFNTSLTLSWNVFDGFLRESAISSARASELTSTSTLTALEDQLSSSVITLRNSLLLDIQYYRDSMLALERASEQYELSRMSYEMGALSLIDLLSAQSDLASAEANLVSARIGALRTEASLMVTLGSMPRLGE